VRHAAARRCRALPSSGRSMGASNAKTDVGLGRPVLRKVGSGGGRAFGVVVSGIGAARSRPPDVTQAHRPAEVRPKRAPEAESSQPGVFPRSRPGTASGPGPPPGRPQKIEPVGRRSAKDLGLQRQGHVAHEERVSHRLVLARSLSMTFAGDSPRRGRNAD
jgi:hypothetical protein